MTEDLLLSSRVVVRAPRRDGLGQRGIGALRRPPGAQSSGESPWADQFAPTDLTGRILGSL